MHIKLIIVLRQIHTMLVFRDIGQFVKGQRTFVQGSNYQIAAPPINNPSCQGPVQDVGFLPTIFLFLIKL